MAKKKQRIGTIPCPLCGVECLVKAEDGDPSKTLNYVCHMGCDSPNYASAGTNAHKLVLEKMKPDASAKPVEKKPVSAAPESAAKPDIIIPEKKKAGFFS